MNDEIVLHDATPEDAVGIRVVQKETWLATYPNNEFGITRKDIEEKVNEMQEEGVERLVKRIRDDYNSHTWVAKKASRIVGFISVQKLREENKIRALYLLPEYQKKGIGRQLMQKALAWLGNSNQISLEVVTYNDKAINFYKSFGFIEQGETTNESAHLPSGKDLPEILMVRK